MNQYNRISNAIEKLEHFPARYKLVDFEPQKSQGLHRMLVDNYIVFFMIGDTEVTVTNVLYSSVNLERRME